MPEAMSDERLEEREDIVAYHNKHSLKDKCNCGWCTWMEEANQEIRGLRQEVKDLSRAQFIAEERKETIRKDQEAMEKVDDIITGKSGGLEAHEQLILDIVRARLEEKS